nr:hypothetical protein [Tanacetum cinerariifolium]
MEKSEALKLILNNPNALKLNTKGLGSKVRNIEDPLEQEEDVNINEGLQNQNGWENTVISAMKDSSIECENNEEVNAQKYPFMCDKSFVNVVRDFGTSDDKNSPKQTSTKAKFRPLFNTKTIEDSDYVLPLANIQAIKHEFKNTLVGYFVGPEMIEVTNAKVVVTKEKLKEARTRQKS